MVWVRVRWRHPLIALTRHSKHHARDRRVIILHPFVMLINNNMFQPRRGPATTPN